MNNREIEQYTRIIDDPNSTNEQKAEVYIDRGLTYAIQGEFVKAIADFTEAIGLATDNETKANVYLDRGLTYSKQGKYQQAIADFNQAIELATDNETKAKVYNNRGAIYSEQGEYQLALADFTQAIKRYTDNNDKANAYINRGVAYDEQEKYPEAIADYKNALNLNPKLKEARINLAIAEVKEKQAKFDRLSGEARSFGLAKEYQEEQDKLNKYVKKCTKWFIVGIGALIVVVLLQITVGILSLFGVTFWRIDWSKISFSLTTILTTLPLLAPIIWLTSFFAKRRSEANMLLQEYSHKTIFAKSYIAYKQEIEKLESPDSNLQPKLLEAMIETLKRSPTTIFSKKHSSDLPIEELKQIIELAKTLKS